jgi:hypothetical protein
MHSKHRRGTEKHFRVQRSRWKALPPTVALAAVCTAQPTFARNDGINSNRPEDNGIYWHGVGGVGIGALGWTASRCLGIPWYLAVPGTLGSGRDSRSSGALASDPVDGSIRGASASRFLGGTDQ